MKERIEFCFGEKRGIVFDLVPLCWAIKRIIQTKRDCDRKYEMIIYNKKNEDDVCSLVLDSGSFSDACIKEVFNYKPIYLMRLLKTL